MTPRHTTLADRCRADGRRAAAGERRTADTDDGYRARGRTPRPEEKGWST